MPSGDLSPSSGLRRAGAAELRRLARARERLLDREQRLRTELADLRRELDALDQRTQLLGDLVGAPQDATATGPGSAPRTARGPLLRGRELREQAARILHQHHRPGEEVHYRAWLDELLAAGYDVLGNDPVASFLTNASRSPLVLRGEAPGTYRLVPERAAALRAELTEHQGELADLAAVIAREPNPPDELRQHRTRLLATIRRLERDVAEADRVLEAPDRAVNLRRRAA